MVSTLTKDDIEILTVEKASITLTRYPFKADQVRFGSFELQTPVLNILVDEDGDILGWNDFVKDDPDDRDGSSDSPDASDQFAVETIRIKERHLRL